MKMEYKKPPRRPDDDEVGGLPDIAVDALIALAIIVIFLIFFFPMWWA